MSRLPLALSVISLVLLALLVGTLEYRIAKGMEWEDRNVMRYPGLKRAVTLAECDRKAGTKWATTGTMHAVSYNGRYFEHDNRCAYARQSR